MAAARTRNLNLFVANLPWTACKKSLAEHFKQFGEVRAAKVIFDKRTGRSKRYGYVHFREESSCAKALSANEHVIEGQVVSIEVSEDKRAKSETA